MTTAYVSPATLRRRRAGPSAPAVSAAIAAYVSPATLRRRRAAAVVPTPAPSPSPTPALRDRQILYLVRDALAATGMFETIETAGDLLTGDMIAGYGSSASLATGDGREDDILGSDASAVPLLRTVPLTVIIAVRMEEADARKDEIDRLHNVVANAVNGQSFGGVTLPTKTRITDRWKSEKGKGAEERQTMSGSFSYIVGGWSGRNSDDK